MVFQFSENNKTIFLWNTMEWNTMFTEYGKVVALRISEMGNTVFFNLKNWFKMMFSLVWNAMFTDY